MTLADVSLLATTVFFAIYGLTCSVEAGVAINLLIDRKMGSRRFFTPLWEVTNVFLIFGITALVMMFNNALQTLASALLSTLIIGLAALIIRACLVLTVFYWRPDVLPRPLAWAFVVCCYTIPLSFASAGAYLFTGRLFWHSFTGWAIVVSAFLGITALGLTSMNRRRAESILPNELFFAAWMIVLGSVLPLSAKLSLAHVQKTPMVLLSVITIIGLGVGLAAVNNAKIKLWRYCAFVALLTPILLAWSNRPFLVGGGITIEDAFSAASYAKAFILGSIIILPLVLLGFYLFWKLLAAPER